jgi:hypothetical protein
MFKLSSLILVLFLALNGSAKSPHGDKLNIKCEVCHDPEGWVFKVGNNKFDHKQTSYPLVGSHMTVGCRLCHSDLVFSNAKKTCISCHTDMHQQTVGLDCDRCHTPRSWIVKNITEIHQLSRFPLQGAHKQTDCYQCHKSASLLRFDPMGTTCADCHLNSYTATRQPSHVAAKFPTDCFLCHTEKNWVPAKFDHNKNTSFPLNGGHQGIDCVKCHLTDYKGASTECISCHQTNYNASTNPGHKAAKFSTDCKTCHSEKAWKPAIFDHNTSTTFPLTGAHTTASCISCHTNGYSGGTPTDCVGCHISKYNNSTNPVHTAAKFTTDCKVCHTSVAWVPSSYNHTTSTSFPLTGGHIGISCNNCHSKGYKGISTECVSCHMINYNMTKTPNHTLAKYPTDCKICHTVTMWIPSNFNHSTATTFPLTGAHTTVSCASCHINGYAGGTPTDCVSCHLVRYNATTNPGHKAAKFPTDCKLCHNVTAWKPNIFNHNTSTTFPLTGAHNGVECISCHAGGYAGTSGACISCHQTNYNSTTNPVHAVAKFSTDCKICHTSAAWKPSTFDHKTSTTFPLTGAHIGVACVSCHANGYTGISTTCISCHLSNYNSATNPSHATPPIGTGCESCHTVSAWKPSTFNHTTKTAFPLAGAHISVTCIGCHTTRYAGTTTACVGCHQNNYNATTNPGHVAAKFSTDCKLCHSVTVWKPTTFNHNTGTTYPLTGSHIGVNCINCHSKGYAGISTACVSCHLPDYNSTTNPPHASAKFPTNCESCHTVTLWTTSTFNHDLQYFRIYSGKHKGRWSLCSECHTSATNYAVFNCLLCHEHSSKTSVDSEHRGVNGYVYNSSNCLSCHPKI